VFLFRNILFNYDQRENAQFVSRKRVNLKFGFKGKAHDSFHSELLVTKIKTMTAKVGRDAGRFMLSYATFWLCALG
jgi:hypothetical protein